MKQTQHRVHADILATRRFIQLPGPNPIVVRGGSGEWDEAFIEGGDIFKNYDEGLEKYYLYYHGHAENASQGPRLGYQIGVAAATQPMGPFTKAPVNPVLEVGAAGSWEDRSVACPSIIKEKTGSYYM